LWKTICHITNRAGKLSQFTFSNYLCHLTIFIHYYLKRKVIHNFFVIYTFVIDVRTSLFSSFDKVKLIIFVKFYLSEFCPTRLVMIDREKQICDFLKKLKIIVCFSNILPTFQLLCDLLKNYNQASLSNLSGKKAHLEMSKSNNRFNKRSIWGVHMGTKHGAVQCYTFGTISRNHLVSTLEILYPWLAQPPLTLIDYETNYQ